MSSVRFLHRDVLRQFLTASRAPITQTTNNAANSLTSTPSTPAPSAATILAAQAPNTGSDIASSADSTSSTSGSGAATTATNSAISSTNSLSSSTSSSASAICSSSVIASSVNSPSSSPSFLIVDVRDDDYKGGHIPHALHFPSASFHDSHLSSLLKRVFRDRPSFVIFHCMYSQQRGPSCARSFCEAWNEYVHAKHSFDAAEKQQILGSVAICVLEGGFGGWVKMARNTNNLEELVEEYEDEYWGPKPKIKPQ